MLSWYQLAQLAFAMSGLGIIAARVRALYFELAISDDALRWLLRDLSKDEGRAIGWAQARPRTQAARMITASDEDVPSLLIDLRDEATARLPLIRVFATLASTLGLLGAILMLTGVMLPDAGLLALQAGAVQRLALQQSIATMAIGVATSAVCFQALSLLRPAASRLISQAEKLAGVLVQRD